MGDQLAKGWADNKAQEAMARQRSANHLRYGEAMDAFFAAQRRQQDLQREAEIEAEEALLP